MRAYLPSKLRHPFFSSGTFYCQKRKKNQKALSQIRYYDRIVIYSFSPEVIYQRVNKLPLGFLHKMPIPAQAVLVGQRKMLSWTWRQRPFAFWRSSERIKNQKAFLNPILNQNCDLFIFPRGKLSTSKQVTSGVFTQNAYFSSGSPGMAKKNAFINLKAMAVRILTSICRRLAVTNKGRMPYQKIPHIRSKWYSRFSIFFRAWKKTTYPWFKIIRHSFLLRTEIASWSREFVQGQVNWNFSRKPQYYYPVHFFW